MTDEIRTDDGDSIKYSVTDAKRYFAVFKSLELFLVFLFFFGFHGLGTLTQRLFNVEDVITYVDFWALGLFTFMILIVICLATFILAVFVKEFFKAWVRINWFWARLASESKVDRTARIIREEKECKDEFVKEYGYYIGDTVKVTEECKFKGTVGKVYDIQKYTYLKDSNGKIVRCTDDDIYRFESDGVKKFKPRKKISHTGTPKKRGPGRPRKL